MSWYWDKWDHFVLLGNDSDVLQQGQKHLYSCQDMLLALYLCPLGNLDLNPNKKTCWTAYYPLIWLAGHNLISLFQHCLMLKSLIGSATTYCISLLSASFRATYAGGCLIISFSNLYLLLMFMISISAVTHTQCGNFLYDHILLA